MPSPTDRIAGVDGLRAIAIAVVIYEHYFSWLTPHPGGDFGGIGVSIFFVISGFLITGNLLSQTAASSPLRFKFAEFYAHRMLRIMPPILLVVGLAYALSVKGFVGHNPLWFIGFAANVLVIHLGHWPDAAGHLWSLAVEEQFYLLWPLVVFLVPMRRLPLILSICIVSTPVAYAVAASWSGNSIIDLYVTPLAHLWALGFGALLAWLHLNLPRLQLPWRSTAVIAVTAFGVAFLTGWLHPSPSGTFVYFLGQASADIVTVAILHGLWLQRSSPKMAARVLAFLPLGLLGMISYTLYLVHVPALYLLQSMVWNSGLGWPPLGISFAALAGSTLFAAISWIALERPILTSKRKITGWLLSRLGSDVPEPQSAPPA